MTKTIGAAVGAAIVILLLATIAGRMTTHEPVAQESALRR
jgi:hypothetical protein